jgi:ankyrin repeat protein
MSLFTASTSAEVKELVRQGHDVNERFVNRNTPLFQACLNNNIEVIEALCILGANVNVIGYCAKSPFDKCCCRGNLEAAKLLVSFGADFNKEDYSGENALYYAVTSGFLNVTKYLVENCKMQITYKIVRQAILKLAVDIIDYFLEIGIDFSKLKNDYVFNDTLLGTAINNSYSPISIDIVDKLLYAGVDVNEKYGKCYTAMLVLISFTVSNQNIFPLMERLILFGADINSPDKLGNTALHYACNNSFTAQVVGILLKQGANPTLKNNRGQTAIDMCRGETLKNLMIEKAKEF